MSVDPRLVSSGLLVPGDVIALVPSLGIRRRRLYDTVTGARHQLDTRALEPLHLLERPIAYEVWLDTVHQLGLDDQEAGSLLDFLNSVGGLAVRRTWTGRWRIAIFWLRLIVHRLRPQPHMWRVQATRSGVLLGVSRAACWLLPLVPGTAAALYALGVSWTAAIPAAALCFVIFLVSTIAHELTHRAWVQGDAAVVQQGLRLGILHRPMPRQREVASAMTGPVVGALTAVGCGLLVDMLAVSMLFALAQLWSLAPWYGDGKTIWKQRKKAWSYSNAAKDNELS